MEKTEFEKYLEERYLDQVRWYDQKSLWNQRWYIRLQWGLIILSAFTPVLVVIHLTTLPQHYLLNWLPVITSVLVAILASSLKTFEFQENWANYRTTCETLKKEIYLCRASVGVYVGASERETLFVERVEALISRENTLWFTTYRGEIELMGDQKQRSIER
jgi:hypothetical protein